MDTRNCECHGVPQYFHRDLRYRRGGFYSCAVKSTASSKRYHAEHGNRIRAQLRERYDNDPVYRIEKRMTDDARERRKTLERRRAALHGAGID